jgi:hypothetical protein
MGKASTQNADGCAARHGGLLVDAKTPNRALIRVLRDVLHDHQDDPGTASDLPGNSGRCIYWTLGERKRLEADVAKAELKTQVNDASVTKLLTGVADEQKRKDGFEILKLMRQITTEQPKMSDSSIVGFGS